MPMKLLEQSSESRTRVYREYGMTSRGVSQDITALKEWLAKQPHLPIIRGEHVDQWLENYLISSKNSLQRAKEGLDCYFSVRTIIPEVFTLRDPLLPAVQKSFEVMGVIILPKLTPEGRRVIMFSHLTPSADEFDATVMLKRISMMMDVMLQEGVDYTGMDVLVDTKNVVFGHLARYNASILSRTFKLGWKGYPLRVNKIHVVNPWPMVETGIALFTSFMTNKLKSRIVVHRSVKDLHRLIPKNVLPADVGGEEPSIAELNNKWKQKIEEYREWFISNEKIKSDEAKRVGKCSFESAAESAFGNSGSFRKIEVD
ncbi:alpha-tocopherol transfer protein-like [Macrosteles quadrilineatus]|uniref:alpha-tocopherol transfer protein-like n=1 Tax=Macrosteles quadrilineatus TaxID=74068 RepID=UPI0023E1AC43|nr:alpha-tocopherol transfer protein-like [Macrosteles quadrilineatus]XP_054287008.1 alpha-tocopherol transfer protein-like [Macrosteles quadrilineatus]